MAKQKVNKVSQDEVLIDIAEVTKSTTSLFEKYRKQLIIGGGAVLVGIAAVVGWKAYVASSQDKAVKAVFRAEQMFDRDSFEVALNGPAGGYDGFLAVISKYGSTPAGNLARYRAGVCYLKLGKFDEAIKQLEDFDPDGKVTPTMKYGLLADAYSEKNDMAKALDLYKKAANAEGPEELCATYLMRFAMLSELQGKGGDALEAYKQVKDKFATTSVARDIDKYIARAESKK